MHKEQFDMDFNASLIFFLSSSLILESTKIPSCSSGGVVLPLKLGFLVHILVVRGDDPVAVSVLLRPR